MNEDEIANGAHPTACEDCDIVVSDPYAYWRSALQGLKPKAFVDQAELGFYRKSAYERNANGHPLRKRDRDIPVAIFMAGDVMTCRIGETELTGDALNELWHSVAGNPITEELYRAVAERGEPWPAKDEMA